METFSALLAICAGNSPVPGFDVFFDLRLNKRLSKQSWGWWFETLSCPLWRHCNAIIPTSHAYSLKWLSRHPCYGWYMYYAMIITFLWGRRFKFLPSHSLRDDESRFKICVLVGCGILERCIVGFVNLTYYEYKIRTLGFDVISSCYVAQDAVSISLGWKILCPWHMLFYPFEFV